MKTSTAILLIMILAFFSCKKDSNDTNNNTNPIPTQKGISYPDSICSTCPDSIYYGSNILSFPDSTILIADTNYEMGAILEDSANLYLIITNYPAIDTASGHETLWFYESPTGWAVDDYNDITNTQLFISSQTGKIDTKILFASFGQIGSCKIDFYENGNTITQTKHFTWQ